jgi:DNA-binding beta-propeller fold protein YncE
MHSNKSNGSCSLLAHGFAALCAALAIGLGLMARPAEAAPFAYVANSGFNTVSVINTATNTVVATIPVFFNTENAAFGVAVTPDGTRAYVTGFGCECGGSIGYYVVADERALPRLQS